MMNNPQNPFPSKEQETLLKAALMAGNEAGIAWEEWNSLVNFESYFDNGSFRLLPLVYKNLVFHKIQHKYISRLKNVYLQSWYKNQKLFYESGNILRQFEEKKIRTLVLKGIPLSILAYKDNGARPMADLDILVPFNQANEAIKFLKSGGWKPENDEFIEYNLKYGRSMMFRNQEGFELDLHWHPLFETRNNDDENDFWKRAIPLELAGFPTFSLCPSDMLLHVIVHGLRWNPEPPIRWVPDAMKLVSTCNDQLDWPYFIRQVRKYRVVLQVKKAFKYLTDNFHLEIPVPVRKELDQIPVTVAEKLLYREAKKDEEKHKDRLFSKLYQLFLIYLRQSDETGFFKHLKGFTRFMNFRTAGKSKLRILWYYFKRGLG